MPSCLPSTSWTMLSCCRDKETTSHRQWVCPPTMPSINGPCGNEKTEIAIIFINIPYITAKWDFQCKSTHRLTKQQMNGVNIFYHALSLARSKRQWRLHWPHHWPLHWPPPPASLAARRVMIITCIKPAHVDIFHDWSENLHLHVRCDLPIELFCFNLDPEQLVFLAQSVPPRRKSGIIILCPHLMQPRWPRFNISCQNIFPFSTVPNELTDPYHLATPSDNTASLIRHFEMCEL